MRLFPATDMQTLPLSFDPVSMNDAECGETNEKSIFPIFIFRVIVKVHRNLGYLSTQMTITRKIKIGII